MLWYLVWRLFDSDPVSAADPAGPVPIVATPVTPASPAAPADAAPSPPPELTEEELAALAAAAADDTIVVTGVAIPDPKRVASEFVVPRELLEAAPHRDAGELLTVAPGLTVGRGEGDAVAHHLFLRGFSADHGQDIELTLAGIPLNQRSHIHGQGYADINFIIPEMVSGVRVMEGVYDPRQGDFATAGSVDFAVGAEQPGAWLRTSVGSLGERRLVGAWSAEDGSFAAMAMRQTDGFGMNRGSASGHGLGLWKFGSTWRGHLLWALSGVRANSAGLLRQADIDAGLVARDGSYAFPTANAGSAWNARGLVGVSLERKSDSGQITRVLAYASYVAFRQRANNTGFIETSQFNPDFSGRGDLVEQSNVDRTFGLRTSYRHAGWDCGESWRGFWEAGVDARLSRIDQAQNLLQVPQNQTWDRRVDATVQDAGLGAWVDVSAWAWERLRLRGGARVEAMFADIDDRLGNFIPDYRPDDYIIGHRRTALGFTGGPRGTVEFEWRRWLTLTASYGEGFRSPQARLLDEGEAAPFTKVRGGELGAIWGREGGAWEATTAAYATYVSEDAAFDPGTSSLERIGPTLRLGAVASMVARPAPWALLSASVTSTHASLRAPPPPTADVPNPPYSQGQLLPYVAPLVTRLDAKVHRHAFELREEHVDVGAGVGVQWASAAPLPYGETGRAKLRIDAQADAHWGSWELSAQVFNVLDARTPELEYNFVSNWQPDAAPSRVPARHVAAAAPRTFIFSLGVHL